MQINRSAKRFEFHKTYSDELLKLFIQTQLRYFPCSYTANERWIVVAAELFDSVIIHDEISITDMTSALQTFLDSSYNESV